MLRDLTGQTFGKLTVIERVQDHITKGGKHLVQWLCKCECGNHAVVLSANLKNGITKSCGCVMLESSRKKMLKIRETFELEDLCGRTINGFDVVGKSKPYKDPKYGYSHQQYICRCTHCGKTKLLRADILKQGKAVCKCNGKSCGRKHEDLTGRRFGKLVVTGYVRLEKPMIIKHKFKAKDCKSEIEVNRLYKNGSYYICQCDCGNVSYVKKSSLVGGKTTSCGCMKRTCSKAGCNMRGKPCDLTGQTFGNLTVIKQVDDYISPKGNHAKRYLCQCACGNHIEVQAGNLKSGNTVACSHSCPCKKKKYKPRDRNDLSGRVFGSLTVEKRVDDYVTPKGVHSSKYLCTCECGKQIEVISSHLASGHTKSCPRCILKKKDIVGQRFGKLVVKEYVETNKTTHVEKILKNKAVPNGIAVTYSYDAGKWYICQCDCGNITYVKRGQLIGGQTKSCGCLKTIKKYDVKEFIVESENFSRSDYDKFNRYYVYVNDKKSEFKTLSKADTFFKRKMIPGNQCSIKAEGEYNSCELKKYDDTGLNTLDLFNAFMEIEVQEKEEIKKQNRLCKRIKNMSEAEDTIKALCYFVEKQITDSSSEDEIARLEDAIGCLKRASKRMLG